VMDEWSFRLCTRPRRTFKGKACVAYDDRWGVIRGDNTNVTTFKYVETTRFIGGHAVVDKGSGNYIIDTLERTITQLPDSFKYHNFDESGTALVEIDGERFGRIGLRGHTVIPPVYGEVSVFNGNGIAAVRATDSSIRGMIGFVNRRSKMSLTPRYKKMELSSRSGYVVVYNDSGWGVVNSRMQVVVPCQYDDMLSDQYNQGLFATMKDDKWGYIDTKGLWVVMPKYDEARPFSEGLAAVKKDDVWMYIDKKGKEALRFE